MGFELRLERAAPPLSSDDPRAVALAFLRKVGAVGEGFDPLGDGDGPLGSPPVRVLVECLMGEPERSWAVAEMARAVGAPAGQVYRAVAKFEGLDWLAQAEDAPKGALPGKRYRLRFGRLASAWRFTEVGASLCLESYGALAKQIEERLEPHREKSPGRPTAPRGGAEAAAALRESFVMLLRDAPAAVEGSPREMAADFLLRLGVIPARTGGRRVASLPSFRMFYSAFLQGGDRWWSFDELGKQAPSTRATLQKHLRRLEGLDLLERAAFKDDLGLPRRHWRLRQGSLPRAFAFTEARARLALDSMGRWAAHLDGLVVGGSAGPRKPRAPRGG